MKDRIRELRKVLGLNQRDFGAKIGVGQSTVANYERGLPPLDTVIRSICREYGVREAWLRDGDGPMMEERARDEALAAELEKVLTAGDDDFRKALIAWLVRMPPDRWRAIEEAVRELLEDVRNVAPPSVHDMSADEIRAEVDRQLAEEAANREKGTGTPSTGSLSGSDAECG